MKIFTYAYNRPDYLIYQSKCLRKFVKEEFEFICIDNSKEVKITDSIKEICQSNNITYYKNINPDHRLEGTSHYSALQWSWDNIISDTNELIVMLDHDNFLIDHLSIKETLGDNDLAGVSQSRGHVYYLNPALMIFDTETMPNKKTVSFNGWTVEGEMTDVGGELYYYLKNNTQLKINFLPAGAMSENDPFLTEVVAKYGYSHFFDLMAGKFFHPRNGSNWAQHSEEKFDKINKSISEIIEKQLNK